MNIEKGLREDDYDRDGKQTRKGEKLQCSIYIYM